MEPPALIPVHARAVIREVHRRAASVSESMMTGFLRFF